MGSGAPRELKSGGPVRELPAELHARLTAAVKKMDAVDEDFKQARDDERQSQLAKAWGAMVVQIDGYLREVAEVLINSHQLSLDMGVEGGGRSAEPFFEETGQKFKRLVFSLQEDGTIIATSAGRGIARCRMTDVSYEWILRVAVEWVIISIERQR